MAIIGILGTGTMGPQIASAIAASGHEVRLYNRSAPEKSLPRIRHDLKLLARKAESRTRPIEGALDRIRTVTRLTDLSPAEIVVEAVVEDLDIKRRLFKQIESICAPTALLTTNTSNLALSDIASMMQDPSRLLGLHFLNPVFETGLVEVIRMPTTSSGHINQAVQFVRQLGKVPILLPESCINRALIPMINEAAVMLEQAMASAEDIDRVFRLGAKHPLGPLALADLIGIDIVVSILSSLENRYGARYRASNLLVQMRDRGDLGRKTGRGFFSYGRPR